MVKEDRSGWVAVAPEYSNTQDDLPTVTPAQSAYQIFNRKNSKIIKAELAAKGEASDLANLSKAISQRWQNIAPDERYRIEREAENDRIRFMKESHLRDKAVMERKERLRQEREEIIVIEGNERRTRGARRKEIKKSERSERKKAKLDKKARKRKLKQVDHSDEDEFQSDDGDDSSSAGSEYDSDGSDSSSQGSDSDDSNAKSKRKKKRAAPVVSAAVLARRETAKKERETKEAYIAGRQNDLRTERASQAKKRLDFLLKQSDIFQYFGEVKEDKGNFYGNRGNPKQSANNTQNDTSPRKDPNSTFSHRRESTAGDNATEELAQADESQATFLTSQPSTLGFGKMRAYQLEGLNWMIRLQENGVNGILADEMGLGKTLQSISILVYMLEYADVSGPHLIVVPKSTLSNWMKELGRWAPTLKTIKFHGTKDERERIAREELQPGQRDENRSWQVCVTTYEICNLDKNVINKFAWSYLIIDEAHRLKNEASSFSKTIRTFETRYRLLLTGTPLQNNLHELWALLNFLVPDVFASAEQFDDWFNLDIDDADEKNKLISQLHKILRPFMLRRLKVDVEKSLPPKHETILYTGMSAVQKKLYKEILMRDIEILKGGSGSHTAVLNIVMQLRKCAGHPYLFPGVEDRTLPPLGEHLVKNCGKMVLLDKLLKRMQELGHRVLLFTQMTRLLDIFEDYMVMRQFKYCRIDGNTDYEIRENSIEAFNRPNSEKFIFLLSTRAGGLGINLQTANVVILYDSDWNPQADLQAQDRAHRIGQKKPVQVFCFVTEHTIEEKVVERAQQKLKLDAMVVQQGRLKEKDNKISREELLSAVRFGADKVFKSKDSSITDDDIELILEAGKKKTQELNEKLVTAEKGDLLDFKLGGDSNMQTFEGIDYSKQDFAQAKAAQEQAELLGILDMGKRERRTVANYNEDQLYRQQIASKQPPKKVVKKKKEVKLPRHLKLPRLDEWQMFDRDALNAIQEEEEQSFRDLPEEMQMVLKGRAPVELESTKTSQEIDKHVENGGETMDTEGEKKEEGEQEKKDDEKPKRPLTIEDVPPLLSKEKQEKKERLLSEGFADWGRSHYAAFIKACVKYGRNVYTKIATEVGKPQSMVEAYADAFWDENIGKKRFSEAEYDRNVKKIESGEKKINLIKVLEDATSTFVSLFDNPWRELEFTHVNVKDKLFSTKEDRHLLCWAHKYGYGQWEAVKMAVRRSPDFRFDYYLRSLHTDFIGKRCEQLMKAAEKEVEHMVKKYSVGNRSITEEEKKDTSNDAMSQVKLPKFKIMRELERKQEEEAIELERKQQEKRVEDIENQMEKIQNRLKMLQKYSKQIEGNSRKTPHLHSEFPEDLLPDLANLVATSGSTGAISIANEFISEHGQVCTKKTMCAKIEDIANKERRKEDGDARPVWHILPEYMNLLSVSTIRHLRKEKDSRMSKRRSGIKRKKGEKDSGNQRTETSKGAIGPDGNFVDFPPYDGSDPPRDCKKAFTLFCNGNRKDVKRSLPPAHRKDRDKVNSILKQRWSGLSDEEKDDWKKWQIWDSLRFKRDSIIFNEKRAATSKSPSTAQDSQERSSISPTKKRGSQEPSQATNNANDSPKKSSYHIPKKKKRLPAS